MKSALLAAVVITLSGCAGLTNKSFDSTEFSRYVDISTGAKKIIHSCSDEASVGTYVELLSTETEFAVGYSANKLQNQRITAAGKELHALVVELSTRYKKGSPSEGYCQLKLSQVAVAAESIAQSISKKEK